MQWTRIGSGCSPNDERSGDFRAAIGCGLGCMCAVELRWPQLQSRVFPFCAVRMSPVQWLLGFPRVWPGMVEWYLVVAVLVFAVAGTRCMPKNVLVVEGRSIVPGQPLARFIT